MSDPAPILSRQQVPDGMRVPDFFIVGHKKSGTTALHAMLSQHPEVFMPRLKEPHFLATDRKARFANPRGGRLPETLEEYLHLFDPAAADERAGEASASYLWSQTAAEGIASLAPEARVIAILREPASFLRSQYLQFRRIHFEDQRSMRDAIALDDDRREGRKIPAGCPYPQMLIYSDHVRYAEQLRRYHARFPREQVLVLIYEEFRADNPGTLREVTRFLGIDEEFAFEEVEVNTTSKTMRSQGADDVVRSLTDGSGAASRVARAGMKALPKGLRRRTLAGVREHLVFGAPPPVDEGLMLELRRRFKPQVEAAADYLGRDLVALWGYDRLD
jgi:Sulfotransferase family